MNGFYNNSDNGYVDFNQFIAQFDSVNPNYNIFGGIGVNAEAPPFVPQRNHHKPATPTTAAAFGMEPVARRDLPMEYSLLTASAPEFVPRKQTNEMSTASSGNHNPSENVFCRYENGREQRMMNSYNSHNNNDYAQPSTSAALASASSNPEPDFYLDVQNRLSIVSDERETMHSLGAVKKKSHDNREYNKRSSDRNKKFNENRQNSNQYFERDARRWPRDAQLSSARSTAEEYEKEPVSTHEASGYRNRGYNGGRYHSNGTNDWRVRENRSKTSDNRHESFNTRRNNEPSMKNSKNHPDFQANRNLKSFTATNDGLDTGKCSQREKLTREIDAGKLECPVCCETIKPFQSTWSCVNCFHIFHLNCIIKWAASSKSDDGWRCPACQNTTKRVPRDYYCFCGKTKNPQYNRNDVAHTCGEVCGRQDVCEHMCTLLCHPGPCPPCQASVTRSCGCSKTKKIMQCSQKDDILCDAVCNRALNCGLHSCSEKCHAGPCAECEQTLEHSCHCSRETKTVACTSENRQTKKYSCGECCDQKLTCGNHKCTKLCHPEDCGLCRLSPNIIICCPCGKSPILKEQRKSCTDPIPTCNALCTKPFKCGPPGAPHFCKVTCHLNNCPPCNKETSVKCRCGNMNQMIKCRQLSSRADDARCKKRCTKKRNCGKHKCNQECCIDIDHICPLPCSFTLSCGKHKCDQTCHKGRCLPCYRSSFDELFCECGANVIYPPVPCGTKKPLCSKPCSRQHVCDHPVLHNCHAAQTCPPCMIQTTKFCYGKHEQRKTIPCSQGDFGCGLPCNKPLTCNRHKCIKPCHPGDCMSDTDVCKQNCTKPRTSCGHKCNAPCHEGDCPEIACKENVEVICQCGNRKQTRMCSDVARDFKRIATARLASSMQEMQRGNSVELSDILGPIKINNNKTLDCNEECRVLERNRKLAIGLQIRNPDVGSKLQPRYSEFIRGWAKKDSTLVKNIHDKLTELVKLSKESKQRSRSHSFPIMNREKRQLVHEMCEMFGVESIAYDAEPNRNVVATAQKEKSWLPSMSILEVLQRENGQRRVPVPRNAVWGSRMN